MRQEILNTEGKRKYALDNFGLDENKPVVLSIGGSQGARSINNALDSDLEKFVEKGYQLLWQTGRFYTKESHLRLQEIGSPLLRAYEFIYDMDLAYAAADVIISRSGAMSVTEMSIVGKPCVLVPFPFAAEDHQTENAMALVNNDAGILVKDTEVKQKLFPVIDMLISDAEKRDVLIKNIQKLKIENAADLIMIEVDKLLNIDC